jgi:alpha-amylase/alpha-mannosidase (GH57 family)
VIKLLFLWHLHQPNYRHAASGEYILPWVRLHAAKGYLDLLSILQRYDSARSVVNFSGILLEQLMEYQAGRARDKYELLSAKAASDLTSEERAFVVRYFFSANRDHMINPHMRYRELLAQRQDLVRLEGYAKAAERMNDQDITDIMVWFNLAWIGFTGGRRKDVLDLLKRSRGYGLDDQRQVLAIHRELAGQVLAGYRDLQAAGRIELSITPYQHPILPLLHDCAGVGTYSPHDALPVFQYPEDAEEHVRRGNALYEQAFGVAPTGAWPAEGSVSDAALGTLSSSGLRWAATDQQNLPPQPGKPMPHLAPYRWKKDGSEIVVFFRDTRLADNIGFEYATWQPVRAGNHLVEMALDMGRRCQCQNPVITVALDGENPWETYADGGRLFLSALFERIAQEPDLECRTARELINNPDLPVLEHIHAGSWIGGNFNIWSGHAEDKAAWRRLAQARRDLVDVCQGEVYDHLLSAEGSDWFWWYGDEFTTEEAAQFDELFRSHLIAAYQAAGRPVPDECYTPIISDRHPELVQEVRGLSDVTLDGKITHFFEWRNAVALGGMERQASMARSAQGAIASECYYGFTTDCLVLRLDLTPEWLAAWRASGGQLELYLTQQEQAFHWEVPMSSTSAGLTGRVQCVVSQIMEVSVELEGLNLKRGAVAHFWVELHLFSGQTGRVPGSGPYPIRIIEEDFAARNWWV